MTPHVAELLADAYRLGVQLQTDGRRLRSAPQSRLTPELIERLSRHKGEVIEALGSSSPPAAPLSDKNPNSQQAIRREASAMDDSRVVRPPLASYGLLEIREPKPCSNCGSAHFWRIGDRIGCSCLNPPPQGLVEIVVVELDGRFAFEELADSPAERLRKIVSGEK